MRNKEASEYKRLLDKYKTEDDLYRLIDMMRQQHSMFASNCDPFAYMRNILERHEDESLSIHEKKED